MAGVAGLMGLDRRDRILHAEASWEVSASSHISLLLRSPPVFPMAVGKTHLLTKDLPCWTFEVSYFMDS